ncbi:MAG: DUF2066 domain-containing protein [Gammaproteobacteria bacterium HGW-Gammaproteobacteria-3]|jgi:hypothetical protein|nr:MAG: DUF2066 domain-containing protein [Gammaproteobacteria bacterium HGW-Gammaproteobacteria-3]
MLLKRLLICAALLFGPPGFAVDVHGLFEAEVISFSQQPEDHRAAIHDALMIVLNRILVGDNIEQDPAVQKALAYAASLVRHEQYSRVENKYDTNTLARNLRVVFDDAALLDLLQHSRLPLWNEIRPNTLVWLVVESFGDRRFFKPKAMPGLDHLVQKAARRQGLPLLFPRLDKQELKRISIDQVLTQDSVPLLKLSSRYGAPAILVGRLVNRQWCWQSQWTLYFDQDIQQWTGPCNSRYEALLLGVHGAYEQLAAFYSVKPDVAKPAYDFEPR